MYRVFDTEQKKWVEDNVYLSPNDELFQIKKTLFGNRLVKLSSERYVFHKDINLFDKDGKDVFEGDFIKAHVDEDRYVLGIVTYANEFSGYIILCFDSEEFFSLGNEICDLIKVVGNVFDGIGEEYGSQQSLQEETV